MNLRNKFDQAQSTDQQWIKYKAMVKQPTLAELDKRYIEETIKTEWQKPRVITVNEDRLMKYKVTTDQLPVPKGTEIRSQKDCCAGIHYDTYECEWYANYSFLEANECWFKPIEQVEEGDWIIGGSGTPLYVNRVFNRAYSYTKYIDDADPITDGRLEKSNFERKASTDEIEEALIKEAKRRDLVDKKIQSIDIGEFDYKYHYQKYSTNEVSECKVSNSSWYYNEERDYLASTGYGYPVIVYSKGEFAEPIDQTPDIEINGKTVELEEDWINIGCETLSPQFIRELDHVMQRHGAKFKVYGEDITGQIKQIASYYEKQ